MKKRPLYVLYPTVLFPVVTKDFEDVEWWMNQLRTAEELHWDNVGFFETISDAMAIDTKDNKIYHSCSIVHVRFTRVQDQSATKRLTRRIFVLFGPSGLGKSFLSSQISHDDQTDCKVLNVIETDESRKLDLTNTRSLTTIIIVGNKYPTHRRFFQIALQHPHSFFAHSYVTKISFMSRDWSGYKILKGYRSKQSTLIHGSLHNYLLRPLIHLILSFVFNDRR